MGGLFDHTGTYQEYAIKSVAFSRSIGMTPDTGSLVINFTEFQKIDIDVRDVHWRCQGGPTKQLPAGINIDTFFEIIQSAGSTIVDDVFNQPVTKRDGGGFREAGDLVILTTKDGQLQPETRYADIYIDTAGISEVTMDLANVRDHNTGDVRIPITDIRKYWRTYGNLYQRINTRLRTGKLDPMSVKADGSRYPFRDVLRFLFSILPGCPPLHSKSDLAGIDPPEDIIGEGQPVIEILEKLLSRNGLVVGLLPNNQVFVQKFPSASVDPDTIPLTKPGETKPIVNIAYETKTSAIGEKPTIAEALGKKRLRRMTLSYIPVFPDESGVWRRLIDVGVVFPGVSFDDVAQWASAGNEKAFRNIGPPGSRNAVRRSKILLDHAFKSWAPAAFFEEANESLLALAAGFAAGGGTIPTFAADSIPGFTDKDVERLPFMPMQEAPLYQFQLEQLEDRIPLDTQETDKDEVVLVKPAVRATRIGWGFFKNFESIQNIFDSQKDQSAERIKDQQAQLQVAQLYRDNYSQSLVSAVQRLADLSEPRAQIMEAIGQEVIAFFTFQAVQLSSILDEAIEIEEGNVKRLKDKVAALEKEVIREKETLNANILRETQIQVEFDALKSAFQSYGGIHLIFNLPAMLISSGYALNRDTGIVQFANPMMVSDLPFYMDADHAKRASRDASEVYVTFGYEIDNNAHLDWTSVQVGRRNGKPEVISTSTPPFYSTFVVRQPTMQLYEEDQGSQMNIAAVKEKGLSAVKGILDGLNASEGFNQQLDGFLPVVLSDGVVGVQHVWNGDEAITWVAKNSITGALPLGPITLKDRVNTSNIETELIMQAKREPVE